MKSPLITSRREGWLWLLALTVLVAIYSTLGAARIAADYLRARNLLGASFAALLIVIVGIFVWQWWRKRPGWSEIGVALGVALAYWLTFLRIENPAERTHLMEYGVVAALIHMALLERASQGRPVPWPAAITVVATAVLGLIDEGIQLAIPSRFFDWNDVFFNAFAGFMVIVARLALAPVERPGWRLWFLWVLTGAIGWGWSMDPSLFGEGYRLSLASLNIVLTLPPYGGIALGASIVGILHWLVLRHYLAGALAWVPAGLGSGLIVAIIGFLTGLMNSELSFVVTTAIFGLVAGGLQWIVLRRQLRLASWWVVVNVLAWWLAVPAGDLAGPPGWAYYPALTGAVLVWLLRRQPAGAPEANEAVGLGQTS